jgi:hypothetical protein
VHIQHFDLLQTSRYIGIDLTPCFRAIPRLGWYFYGTRKDIVNQRGWLVCEKGPRHQSIESHLYRIAKHEGIDFIFNAAFDPGIRNPGASQPSCIVATGLESKTYDDLAIPHRTIYGCRTVTSTARGAFATAYYDLFTHAECAYAAAYDDLLFCLLFSFHPVAPTDLEAFAEHLHRTENISCGRWCYSTGALPVNKNPVLNNLVLAGTLSGMIDPFFLNGISAALLSGAIAALYFTDPARAQQEFRRLTRHFAIKYYLRALSSALPCKRVSFPLVSYINSTFAGVGVL